MPESGVRLARMTDVDDMAEVNLRSWQQRFVDLLPADTLAGMAAGDLSLTWASSILNPPTPNHRVLVAIDDGVVVGYAAIGPSQDPDAVARDGDLAALEVHPHHQRVGHGSRLLHAAMDYARETGLTTVSVWCPLADEPRRAFLQSAGWAPDSAYRDLMVGWDEQAGEQVVREVRLVVGLD